MPASSTSSRPSITPFTVREAGTVGLMPTPWYGDPSGLVARNAVNLMVKPPGIVKAMRLPRPPGVAARGAVASRLVTGVRWLL